jgi:hypothetical protein
MMPFCVRGCSESDILEASTVERYHSFVLKVDVEFS